MNRRNALFFGHDEGSRNWVRFDSLICACKMNGVEQLCCNRVKQGAAPAFAMGRRPSLLPKKNKNFVTFLDGTKNVTYLLSR
jgi:hypothetical protein